MNQITCPVGFQCFILFGVSETFKSGIPVGHQSNNNMSIIVSEAFFGVSESCFKTSCATIYCLGMCWNWRCWPVVGHYINGIRP